MPATTTKKKRAQKRKYVPSEARLASELGYKTRSVIQNMRAHSDCPKKEESGFDVEKWREFDLKIWRPSRVKHAKTEENSEFAQERLRKIKLENEEQELKNKKIRGELLGKDEVCSVICDAFQAMAESLNRQAGQVAPEVAGLNAKEAMLLMRAENKEVLENFALGDWAKKKAFWKDVYATFQSLHQSLNHGSGGKKT